MDYPIRVLFLDNIMDRGGAQAMVMNYYRNIDRNLIQFDFLIHRDYEGAFDKEIKALGGKIYHIIPPYPQNYYRYKKDIGAFFDKHPEYRILHSSMTETALFAFEEAYRRGIPVRICHAHTARIKKEFTPKSIVRNLYLHSIKKYTTHRFSCGKAAALYVFGSEDNITYLPNAIDSDMFEYHSEIENEVRKEFSIEGKFVVGHVGRFFEPKNHLFIIDIFSEVYKRNSNAVLFLVGGGELDNTCMNQVKDKVDALGLSEAVIFTGVRQDVNRIMQAFDVFILPSLWEGFPVVMVEAQSIGVRCLISDKVSPECILTDYSSTVPLDAGAKGWAEKILEATESHKGVLAKENIIKKGYDIRKNAEWLQNFYIKNYKEIKKE